MRDHYGPQQSMEKVRENLPKWIEQAAETPMLLHQLLSQQVKPLPRHLKLEQQKQQAREHLQVRQNRMTMLASGGLIATAVLYALDERSGWLPQVPDSVLVSGLITLGLLWSALRK